MMAKMILQMSLRFVSTELTKHCTADANLTPIARSLSSSDRLRGDKVDLRSGERHVDG